MPPIRKCRLRALLDTITIDETDQISSSSISVVNDVLQKLKSIEEPNAVSHVDETFLGAKIYNAASNLTYECIKLVTYEQHNFDPNELIDKYINSVTEDHPDDYTESNFYSLSTEINLEEALPGLHNYSSLFGGLSNKPLPTPPPRRQVVKEANKEKPVKKHLNKVTEFEDDQNKKADQILGFHLKVLHEEYNKNEKEPVDYFEYVVDTQNFGTTVENIFYTSFVLNDGRVKLILGDEDKPLLEPNDKKDQLNLEDPSKNMQMVTSITMAIWKSLCTKYQIGLLQKYRKKQSKSK